MDSPCAISGVKKHGRGKQEAEAERQEQEHEQESCACLLGQVERGRNQREAPRSAGRCTVGDSDGPRSNISEGPGVLLYRRGACQRGAARRMHTWPAPVAPATGGGRSPASTSGHQLSSV